MSIDRRTFLTRVISGSAALSGGRALSWAQAGPSPNIPAPQDSGIEHIVVVFMENRSFDHLLGWLPGANGSQAGRTFADFTGATYTTHALAPDYTGCGHPDPDHSYTGSRVALNNGAMDGFMRAGKNDAYSIGYYEAADIPFYAGLAQTYSACDNWFASTLGATFPNRMFMWAAQTDRLGDSMLPTGLTTIFDRLKKARVSRRYYFNNLPYLALWGFRYLFDTSLFSEFLRDAAAGRLPAVSFIDPVYTILDDGTGNDDHPHADVRNGDAFLSRIFHTLVSSPKWANTVLIVNFDEWGGFFEHVPPPRVVAPNKVDSDLQNGNALLGFRVPVVIASPFTYGNGVDHTLYDHTSALKLIEWRWNLAPLTARDASADIGNPALNFNFSNPYTGIPSLPQVPTVSAAPCFQGGIFASSAGRAGSASAATPNAVTGLAQSPMVRQWLDHPRFRGRTSN